MSLRIGATLVGCVTFLLFTEQAYATFPEKPVHFYVGVGPGGGTDTLARVIAQKLSEKWGQPVVVENKPGSSGILAADLVAHQPPGGYAVDWITSAHTVTATMYKVNYDPIASFAPITEVAYIPDVLLAIPSLGVNNLKDLVALAKAKPDALNYGSPGNGTPPHLEAAFLNQVTGTQMMHVPFKSGPEVIPAMLGGQIQLYFAAASTGIGPIRAGTLIPLAVSATVRSALMPDVPTIAEALGIDHFEAANSDWTGAVTTAGTPKEVVDQLNRDIAEVLKQEDTKKRLADLGFVPVANSSEQFTQNMKTEIARWAELLNEIGIQQANGP